MARRIRVETPGYHHVYNRGVEKRVVFLEKEDKEEFIKILCDTCKIYSFKIHSLCLMDNHYHLLLENDLENLSLGMRQINSRYAQYFNKKYKRVGHLWQDRFKSWYILNENYLFTLFRYIENNPVKAGIRKKIGEYEFSFTYLLKTGNLPECIKGSFVLDNFDTKRFFESMEVPFSKEEEDIISKLNKEKNEKKEIAKKIQKPIGDFFMKYKNKEERNAQIINAVKAGYRQSEISRILNLNKSTISTIVRKEIELSDT